MLALFLFCHLWLAGAALEPGLRPSAQDDPPTGSDLFLKGEYAQAARALRQEIDSGKSTPQSYLYLGVSLAQSGQLRDARSPLQHFVDSQPEDPVGWYAFGLALFHLADYAEARTALERSLALRGNQPQAEKLLGQILVSVAEFGEAERAFLRASKQSPTDFEARYLLGRLYQMIGRVQDAEKALARSLELKPDHALALAYHGTALTGIGRLEEAGPRFGQALLHLTGDPAVDSVVHYEFALHLQKRGEFEQSLREFRAALDLVPSNEDATFEMARSLYQLRRLEEAKTILEQWASRAPRRSFRVHFLLGRICFEIGDSDCGVRESELAETLRGPHE